MRRFAVVAAVVLASQPTRADVVPAQATPSSPSPDQQPVQPVPTQSATGAQPATGAPSAIGAQPATGAPSAIGAQPATGAQPVVAQSEHATIEPATLPELPPAAAPTDDRVKSYRLQILEADALATGFLVAAMFLHQEEIAIFAVPAYLVIPPVMHLSKHRPGGALASLAMRVGFPLIGVVVGDSIPRECPAGDCMGPPGAIYIGLAAGAVAASALDVIFIAKGDESPSRSQSQSAWTPVAGPVAGGFALGVNGRF